MSLATGTTQAFRTGLEIIQSRLKLLSLELIVEKQRATKLVLLLIFASVFGLILLQTSLVLFWILSPADFRLWVFSGVTVFALISMFMCLREFRKQVFGEVKPFEKTIEELGKDIACLEQKINLS